MKVKVELDRRELTLIRVALIGRLDVMARRGLRPEHPSYQDTLELVNGKLWDASLVLRALDDEAGA